MTTLTMPHRSQEHASDELIRTTVTGMIDSLMASLPEPKTLTSEEKRGIIARYTAVLEGNFIYWMTATLLAVKAEDARPILLDNLFEEVRDAHPAMLRRFAIAANAFPGEADAMAVNKEMNDMRVFLGKLSPVQSLASMAFFEGYIQKFMPYLAELASERGSSDMEYTDVHGVCDIAHTDGLFNALSIESEMNPPAADQDLLEGVNLLDTLMRRVVFYKN
jgi:Iron-containing redox enzyme